jgi:2-methylaconitate cis-trans-isomerase PrpF
MIRIEHPSGHLDVGVEQPDANSPPNAMAVRTAQRIMEGTLIVQGSANNAAAAA